MRLYLQSTIKKQKQQQQNHNNIQMQLSPLSVAINLVADTSIASLAVREKMLLGLTCLMFSPLVLTHQPGC